MELPDIASLVSDSILEQICNLVAKMMNNLVVDALFVYTKIGHMAYLLSRCQPDCQIFAFSSMTRDGNGAGHFGYLPRPAPNETGYYFPKRV